MKHLDRLKLQMNVVSNPDSRDNLGGFRLLFVGTGRRSVKSKGWWKTKIPYYSLDAPQLSQPVRLGGKEPVIRDKTMVSLYAPNTSYEEYFERPRRFDDAWIVFDSVGDPPLIERLMRNGRCFFRDNAGLIRGHLRECAQIASVDPGDAYAARAAFLSILALLHRSVASEDPTIRLLQSHEEKRESPSHFQRHVLKTLKENLAHELSIEELAHRLAMSRSTLTHRFSMEMGETFVELKTRLRIEHAQALICNTQKSLKEIAYELGFKEASYFTRLFQKVVGLSPKDYRKIASRRMPPSL